MRAVTLSFNHRATPLALREALAFAPDVIKEITLKFTGSEVVRECMALVTCNRTEFYAVGPCDDGITETLLNELAFRTGFSREELRQTAEINSAKNALVHIFKVASSIDSMVVGEAEILGQFKSAYQAAVENRTVGPYLHKICHAAFRASKRVRTETDIARLPVSMGTLAVDLAASSIGDLSGKTVLLVGAGKMGRLVATHLKTRFNPRLLVTSRTIESSELAASVAGGAPVPFEELARAISVADVVVTSASGGQLISAELLAQFAKKERLILIDLGVPRNIDPHSSKLGNVVLFNIDHFNGLAEGNLSARRAAALMAQSIIDVEANACFSELAGLKLVPLIEELQKRSTEVVTCELERIFSQFPELSAKEMAAITDMARNIASKMVSEPVRRAKEALAVSRESQHDAMKDAEAILKQILS